MNVLGKEEFLFLLDNESFSANMKDAILYFSFLKYRI